MPKADRLYKALKHAFGESEVVPELNVAKGSKDGFDRRTTYTPHPDYAVKPFNIEGDPRKNVLMMEKKFEQRKRLMEKITAIRYGPNEPDFSFNPNPRVFIAVEDEISSPTRKHRLGSIVNASLLGKIGIVSGGDNTYDSLCRIKSYFDYVASRKGLFVGKNVLITKKDELVSLLNSAH